LKLEDSSPVSAKRIFGIDWSGAFKDADGKIYVAELVWGKDAQLTVCALVRAQNRQAVRCFLAGKELRVHKAWECEPLPKPPDGETVLAGLDFAFGFPAGFALPGIDVDWKWEQLADWCTKMVATNKKLEDAIKDCSVASRQFRWPKSGKEEPKPEMRATEEAAKEFNPASVLDFSTKQKQVGKGSIRGIPIIHWLQKERGVAIWPFDAVADGGLTLVEVFPRMSLTRKSKSAPPNRLKQVQDWRENGVAFENNTDCWAVASSDALDAVAAAVGLAGLQDDAFPPPPQCPDSLAREGWIAGLRVPTA
jgi:hypothetical protein